ncbi:MAG: Gfo/Idh/MocA family oxidoreductase [bacterium]|nr:Gfo/Idh/MocA family oxidoreductase [bacterium]MDE0668603.1 Gfo/Idh/MocA family oxidoreductase [bacterium]MYB25175.1 Gfo/Idh/MocA family oxidoreductase [Acidimicrobiia bacterium]
MSDGNEPVRLGVVGLGWWGGELADAAARSGAAVVACYARTDSARLDFAEAWGCRAATSFRELISADDVEGVVLATPHSVHGEQVREAAAAGKAVLVDKPFTLSVADGQRAVAAAADAGTVLMVGHQRRRAAAVRRIRAMLDDGRLGTPLLATSVFTVGRGFPANWRSSRHESPLGGMTGLGVHMIDTFHYLLGPIRRVSAFSNGVLAGEPLDHATGLLFEFASGAVGNLVTSHFNPLTEELCVFGSAASAASTDEGTRLFTQQRSETARREVPLAATDPLAEQLAEFAAAVRGEGSVETDGEAGLAVIAVLEAAVASVERGEAVDVAEFAGD